MEPLPIIIKEVLYPQTIPPKTKTYIGTFFLSESAIQQHLDSNFAMSLENYQIARRLWTSEEGMSDVIELFLTFSEG